jgi:hypothetical protein
MPGSVDIEAVARAIHGADPRTRIRWDMLNDQARARYKTMARASLEIASKEWSDDPRDAGGELIGPGGPHDIGQVTFDTRRAILVENMETAIAESTSRGAPQPNSVALMIGGRINRPPDDEIAAVAPAEHVRHLHLMSWDAAADLVLHMHSLAGRCDFDLTALLKPKWEKLEAEGLTTKPEES